MNTHKVKKNSSQRRGFTLIETLVAIFILLISTTGPLSFAQSGLRASFLARDQIVAFYLAQEAIETLKNKRDNMSLQAQDWLSDFGDCKPSILGDTVACNLEIKVSDSVIFDFCDSNNGCPPMYYNSDSRRFTMDVVSGDDHKYTRTIYTTKVTDNEIQILVEVKWDSNFFGDKRIVAQENIFNWVSSN